MSKVPNLIVPPGVVYKIETIHGVSVGEVEECFFNYETPERYLIDDREEHATNPPTHWFISETNRGRKLKIMIVNRDGNIYLKSAYDAKESVLKLFRQKIMEKYHD